MKHLCIWCINSCNYHNNAIEVSTVTEYSSHHSEVTTPEILFKQSLTLFGHIFRLIRWLVDKSLI